MNFPLTEDDPPLEKAHIVEPCVNCGNQAVYLRERAGRVRAVCSCGKACCYAGHKNDEFALGCWNDESMSEQIIRNT